MIWWLLIFSVLICSVSSESPSNHSCVPTSNPSESGLYLVSYMKANWHKAVQHCRSLGMNLASVTSAEKNERIRKLIADNGLVKNGPYEGVWISGTDLGDDGTFYWIGNGEQVTFTDWLPGEPNHLPNENCIHYLQPVHARDQYGWNDGLCEWKNHFVCET